MHGSLLYVREGLIVLGRHKNRNYLLNLCLSLPKSNRSKTVFYQMEIKSANNVSNFAFDPYVKIMWKYYTLASKRDRFLLEKIGKKLFHAVRKTNTKLILKFIFKFSIILVQLTLNIKIYL